MMRDCSKKNHLPCDTAPTLKQTLGPILDPYRPKTGLNTKRDKFAMPKTNPYCAGVAPFFSASDASLNDCTYCFILLLGDFSVLPVLGGSRVFGGSCLFAEVLSEALGSAWLIPVEDGALDTYCRSETLLPRCYSFLVDCIKVGSVI